MLLETQQLICLRDDLNTYPSSKRAVIYSSLPGSPLLFFSAPFFASATTFPGGAIWFLSGGRTGVVLSWLRAELGAPDGPPSVHQVQMKLLQSFYLAASGHLAAQHRALATKSPANLQTLGLL